MAFAETRSACTATWTGSPDRARIDSPIQALEARELSRHRGQVDECESRRGPLCGGADDHVLGEEILSGLAPHAGRNLCGRISWRELSSLMENADLLLTNDSAPMHLADLVGLQVIGLFGITQPERCGPYTQRQNCIKASGPESASYSFGSSAHTMKAASTA